jgi:hypothetical protein
VVHSQENLVTLGSALGVVVYSGSNFLSDDSKFFCAPLSIVRVRLPCVRHIATCAQVAVKWNVKVMGFMELCV